LKKLVTYGSEADSIREQEALQKMCREYDELRSICRDAAVTSAMVSECHDYKEAAETHIHWLQELSDSFSGLDDISDINSARAKLAEHEVSYFLFVYNLVLKVLFELEEFLRLSYESSFIMFRFPQDDIGARAAKIVNSPQRCS